MKVNLENNNTRIRKGKKKKKGKINNKPLGCHISDVNLTDGGLLGQFAGKDMMALKYPPSLQSNDFQPRKNENQKSRVKIFNPIKRIRGINRTMTKIEFRH